MDPFSLSSEVFFLLQRKHLYYKQCIWSILPDTIHHPSAILKHDETAHVGLVVLALGNSSDQMGLAAKQIMLEPPHIE